MGYLVPTPVQTAVYKPVSEGKDLLVTPHPNGAIYLQGALRGPGKIGTRSGR